MTLRMKLRNEGKKRMLCWLAVFSINCLFCQDPVLVLPVGHTSSVSTAAYSPDGRYIVTASWDNTAKIWDASGGKLLSELKGRTGSLTSAIFSQDGKYILTASWDSTAKIWDVASGNLIFSLKGHNGPLNLAAYSPDGKYIITTLMNNPAKIWNASNGQLISNLEGHEQPVISAIYSPDGKFIVTASWDNTARIWNTLNGKLVKELRGHTASLKSATWSPDGKFIVTTSEDNTLKRWNGQTGKFLYTFFAVDSSDYLAIDKDGRYNGEDIVVIFFANHGVLLQGQKNLYLLTAEASSDALNGMESEVAISTDELREWLRKIKANKQILIIDACNSGQIVQQLQQLIKHEVPADQQRALESLKNNKFIDVTKWFNFAADYVKSLAKNLGGRQDPQIIGNASFVVGLVDKDVIDGIKLSIEKKIFSRSIFIEDEELLNDDLKISDLVDKAFNDLSESGEQSPLVFVADNNLLDSYSIRGKYAIKDNVIAAKISLFKGRKDRVAQFELSETADKKDMLAHEIVQKAVQYLQQSQK